MTPQRGYGDLFAISAETIKAGTMIPEQMAKKKASRKKKSKKR